MLKVSYFLLFQEANHKPSTGRSVLGMVVLLLRVHRVKEAEIISREFGSNCSRDQNVLIEDLLDAYDQNDPEKVGPLSGTGINFLTSSPI